MHVLNDRTPSMAVYSTRDEYRRLRSRIAAK